MINNSTHKYMAKKTTTKPTDANRIEHESERQMPLTRLNFILMACAAAMIIIGFVLMCGPGSTDTAFNPDIFSTRRIVVGPTVAFLGFVFMGAAIMWPDKKRKKKEEEPKDAEA